MRKYDEVQDLLKELRECSSDEAYLSRQAADEITRLRAENEKLNKSRNKWRQKYNKLLERDKVTVSLLQAVVWSAGEKCKLLTAENEKLRAALDLYREAVRIDVTMEGPIFMGSNASALKRAWDADRAALEEK